MVYTLIKYSHCLMYHAPQFYYQDQSLKAIQARELEI